MWDPDERCSEPQPLYPTQSLPRGIRVHVHYFDVEELASIILFVQSPPNTFNATVKGKRKVL